MQTPQTEQGARAKTGANVRKRRQQIHRFLRLGVQVAFFVLFPSAYSACFAGVKYIFNQIGAHQLVELTPFVAILIALCGYTVVFGRFFCGYACAFGSLGDWIFGIHKAISGRRVKRPAQIPSGVMNWLAWLKYLVLGGIIVLCGLQLFGKTTGFSPWDAFSQLRAGQTGALPGYKIGLALLGLIFVGMYFSERFFCRVLCPMGAVFSLLPILPLFTLHRDRSSCIPRCRGCTNACPADISLPDRRRVDVPGDCFQCHKCVNVCPRSNVGCIAGGLVRPAVPGGAEAEKGTTSSAAVSPQATATPGEKAWPVVAPGEKAEAASSAASRPLATNQFPRPRLRGDETWFILLRVAILIVLFWRLDV